MAIEAQGTTEGDAPATPKGVRRLSMTSPRGAVKAGVLLLALFAFLTSWAFASPLGATPDENFHMASIWCAEGERDGACMVNDDETVHAVPVSIPMQVCYAFNPTAAATCQPEVYEVGTKEFQVTAVGNFGERAGEYPGLFYTVMSQFVGQIGRAHV